MKKSRELNMSIPEVTDKIDVREISENFEIIDKILSANLVKRNTSTTEINVTAYPPYYIMKNTENNPIDYFDPIFEETFTLGPLEDKKFFINAPQSLYFTSDVQIEYDYFIPIQEAINDISIPDISASAINGNIKINGTETNVYTHPTGTNPHGTTKSDVGLGNVPNVATNDQTPSYTEASSLAKLTSGEKLSVAFGKISKGVTDLISHLADSVKHITSTERTNWNAAKTKADTNETNISKVVDKINGIYADSDFQEDSTAVMTKTVPTGMRDYAAVTKIGGKTVKDEENQVLLNAPVESVISVSKNLFSGLKYGKRINSTNGAEYASETAACTDFIEVKPSGTIYASGMGDYAANFIAWYDTNKNYINRIDGSTGNTRKASLPGNAKYIRLNWYGGVSYEMYANAKIMISYDSSFPEYSQHFKTTLLIPDSIKSLPDYGVEGNVVDFENGTYTHTNTITDGEVVALSTAETINISDMLIPIRVEAGGTITLQNEHSLDMPNTVVYKKEVSLS